MITSSTTATNMTHPIEPTTIPAMVAEMFININTILNLTKYKGLQHIHYTMVILFVALAF